MSCIPSIRISSFNKDEDGIIVFTSLSTNGRCKSECVKVANSVDVSHLYAKVGSVKRYYVKKMNTTVDVCSFDGGFFIISQMSGNRLKRIQELPI